MTLHELNTLFAEKPELLKAFLDHKREDVANHLGSLGLSVRTAEQDKAFLDEKTGGMTSRLDTIETLLKNSQTKASTVFTPQFKTTDEIHTFLQGKGLSIGSRDYVHEFSTLASENRLAS